MAEDGESIEGTFFQRGFELPLRLDRTETAPEIAPRQQTPRAPFPYEIQEVSIEVEDEGVRPAGTLTLPAAPGPHPAAILLTVAGANDRDESYAGHKPFLVLADELTRRGVAVLRTDDRGVGGSTGDLLTTPYKRLANDALEWFDWLTNRADIDGEEIDRGVGFASDLFDVLLNEADPVMREAKAREILERPGPRLPVAAALVAPGDIDGEVAL